MEYAEPVERNSKERIPPFVYADERGFWKWHSTQRLTSTDDVTSPPRPPPPRLRAVALPRFAGAEKIYSTALAAFRLSISEER